MHRTKGDKTNMTFENSEPMEIITLFYLSEVNR